MQIDRKTAQVFEMKNMLWVLIAWENLKLCQIHLHLHQTWHHGQSVYWYMRHRCDYSHLLKPNEREAQKHYHTIIEEIKRKLIYVSGMFYRWFQWAIYAPRSLLARACVFPITYKSWRWEVQKWKTNKKCNGASKNRVGIGGIEIFQKSVHKEIETFQNASNQQQQARGGNEIILKDAHL